MPITHSEILIGFIVPGIVTAALLLLLWWPLRKRAMPPVWHGALALGAGMLIGYYEFLGPPWDPRRDVKAWMACLMMTGMVLGTIDGLIKVPRLIRALAVFALSAGVTWMLVQKQVGHIPRENPWTNQTAALLAAAIGLLAALSCLGLDYAGQKRPGPWVAILLVVVSIGAALALGGSIRSSELGGTLTAITVALALATLLVRKVPVARGVALQFVLVLAGMLVHSYLYNSIPLYSVLLLIVAPGMIAVAEIPPLRNTGWWGRGIIKLLIVLALAAVAARPGVQSIVKSMHADEGGMEDE